MKLTESVSVLLNKVSSREMEMFTMHDAKHARKVAHLMWHILTPEQQLGITPPEIALMVGSAFFHDLGMFLSPDDRKLLLEPDSKLWLSSYSQRENQKNLKQQLNKVMDTQTDDSDKNAYLLKLKSVLIQSEEAILCRYVREQHASIERYNSIIDSLRNKHQMNRSAFPSIDACMSFDGQSLVSKMIAICVSHNKSEQSLISEDIYNQGNHEFCREYPVGSSSADLLMVACALRLADILDFDRERTPEEIYQYFISGRVDIENNRSALEWGKHMAVSNWHIYKEKIVYNIVCDNHIVHHAIVKFCSAIEKTVSATKRVCDVAEKGYWPFILPEKVVPVIQEEGYRYLPISFSLDDERIYSLLMGKAIYQNPLDAIRELLQNSVDACALRDALIKTDNASVVPNPRDRIIVEFIEPSEQQLSPILRVWDSGTGMDEKILTDHFLKAGSSYYKTEEFADIRARLWKAGSDFAPVSDFGIGFLSCFLLGDQIQVETSMWENIHGDTKHRILEIDGLTRLIKLVEKTDTSPSRFKGTCISIHLLRGSPIDPDAPPSFKEILNYIRNVCFCLPYEITIKHVSSTGESKKDLIVPKKLVVDVPKHLKEVAVRIPVENNPKGITGEIVLYEPTETEHRERELAKESSSLLRNDVVSRLLSLYIERSQYDLIRGGFKVGEVPGLPECYSPGFVASAVLSLGWESQINRRYPSTNLSRNSIAPDNQMGQAIIEIWLSWLIDNISTLKTGFIKDYVLSSRDRINLVWLEKYNCMDVYRLARNGWHGFLRGLKVADIDSRLSDWEAGKGNPLPLGSFKNSLYRVLLNYLLPKICSLSLIDTYICVSAPSNGWRNTLNDCHDYITNKEEWSNYIEYSGDNEELILFAFEDVHKLNLRYRERIERVIGEDEVCTLINGLMMLAEARQERQVVLSSDASRVIRIAQESFGELKVGSRNHNWRIDSLSVQ
ncbi:MAG: ATP-binding protein [Candidatus Sabulitectum sp.]|nr:ATP-binding protein [Candidatus Sabulitectum sp.]